MPRPRVFHPLLVLCAMVWAALLAAESASPEQVRRAADPAAAAERAVSAAQRVWIDPETGRRRAPTEAELAAAFELDPLRAALAERLPGAEGLRQEPLPGGVYRVELQGRFLSAMVATRGADGRLTTRCVPGVRGSEGQEGESHDH